MRSFRRTARWLAALVVVAGLVLVVPLLASATTEESDPEPDPQLVVGADVYTAVCEVCHQAGGVGTEGVFPPLLNNENVQDAAYVKTVIEEGRSGELIANGVTYDSLMPAVPLSDEDVDAVVAYIVAGFPEVGEDTAAVAPVAGTAARELPGFSGGLATLAYLVAVVAIAAVLLPQIATRGDTATWTWPTAWLKTAAIVLFFVLGTVFLPSMLLEFGPVARSSRVVQDLLGSGVWAAMLALGLYLLWRGKRESRL